MQAAQDLLLAALRSAPRRYLLPPLPAGPAQARAAGVEPALAFAIDSARIAAQQGADAPEAVRELFVWALGAFLRAAMAAEGGDASFQALVLQAHDEEVRAYAQLSRLAVADRRALRALVDAVAHPGKTRSLPPGEQRDTLARLHALATGEAWSALRDELEATHAHSDHALRAALEAIRTAPALERLTRREALRHSPAVQRYQALCARRGPAAGTRAAAAQGRTAARSGEQAEHATVAAFQQLAALLQARAPGAGGLRVLRSLRPLPGFPGAAGKAKDEWDVALVWQPHADILLLAEVKASPAAASSDFARLHRGLERLAQADEAAAYAFSTAEGEVRIRGASLRLLQPPGRALPPHVIYCCTAPPEAQPPLLSAASKAVLAAEPASLAFAGQVALGAAPTDDQLLPVWDALMRAPRLRATLHQDPTARTARAAMLHPDDLVAGLAALAPEIQERTTAASSQVPLDSSSRST